MKKAILTIFISGFIAAGISAHLCDDVFALAKNILAVKVDVRDGELRINDTGYFRVYVLNTMDADTEVRLNVISDEFNSIVKPSDDWKDFPQLKTVHQSGKKEYFEVTLNRKNGVKPGSYSIKLDLYGRQQLKVLNLNESVQACNVPAKDNEIVIDGKIDENEWGKGLLCGTMKEIIMRSWSNQWGDKANFEEKITSNMQSRFRIIHDADNLYCLVDFQKLTKNDAAVIYVSPDTQTSPVTIRIDTVKKTAECSSGSTGLEYKFNNEKVELKIPYELLKLKNKNYCYLELERSNKRTKTYWMSDKYTFNDPVFYAHLNLN